MSWKRGIFEKNYKNNTILLHAQRIHSLKYSHLVIIEYFSIEPIEAIARNCCKKCVTEILKEFARKSPYQNSNIGRRM